MLDIEAIQKILPQRIPFLMIDRVLELEPGKKVVAIKNVTINEKFFAGHFPPGAPIMPGVLIIEAMAQSAIILFYDGQETRAPQKKTYYLSSVKVRFLNPVVPGDQLKITVEPVKVISNAAIVNALVQVGEKEVAKGELSFSVKKMNEPIVVTGIGVVSSIGIGKDNFWKALIAGESGISEITSFDTSNFPTHFGGEIKDFEAAKFLKKIKTQKIGRASSLAIAAAYLAIEDAKIDLDKMDKEHVGICLGTTMGEAQIYQQLNEAWVKKGIEAMDISLIPYSPPNVLATNLAMEFGLAGPNYLIPTACAAGNYCIGYACDLLRKGDANVMLAGGADAFSRLAFTGFNRLLAVAPEKCQPFDKNRKGMLVGEGSGLLVLEPLEQAKKRNAQIYAQVLGYGLSCDANHMTAPHAAGIALALEKALQESALQPEDVDYINAHGTGTPANDKEECLAIKKVFPALYKKIPVSSIKSMLGHTMGAASAIESVACCLSLKHGVIPPTINFQTPDPECDIDCVPNCSRKLDVEVVLNNASAFGGNNACVAFRKPTL